MEIARRDFLKRSGKALASMSLVPLEGKAGGLSLSAAAAGCAEFNPLANQDQLALEGIAIRLFHSTPVRAAMGRGRKLLDADWRAKRPAGQQRLDLYLGEMSFLSCLEAAVWNADQPKLLWVLNLPHRWFGRNVPGSRCGVDNPDNVHRLMRIDPGSAYVITGRVPPVPATQVSFNVSAEFPGNGRLNPSLGTITLADLALDSDRGFRLTLDSQPADGRPNHLRLSEECRVLLVRDTMSDWGGETPLFLTAERVRGPVPRALDEAGLAEFAARIVDNTVPFWSRLMEEFFFFTPKNKLKAILNPTIGKGRQFGMNSHFSLKPDEAYVLTLDPGGADYAGIELCDLWGASVGYANHTSSLNKAQAAPNPDGTITYVLSLTDPGVYNWLDPEGLDEGSYMFRFQGFKQEQADFRPENVIRQESVVKLAELDGALPSGMRRVTPDERRRQIDDRCRALQRRIMEDGELLSRQRNEC